MAGFNGPPTPLLSVLERSALNEAGCRHCVFHRRSLYQRCEQVYFTETVNCVKKKSCVLIQYPPTGGMVISATAVVETNTAHCISRTPKCVRVGQTAELVSTSAGAMIKGGGLVAARQLPPPYVICTLKLENRRPSGPSTKMSISDPLRRRPRDRQGHPRRPPHKPRPRRCPA